MNENSNILTCETCRKPAKSRVVYKNRRTRKVLRETYLCVEHIDNEFQLSARNLSMADFELYDLNA